MLALGVARLRQAPALARRRRAWASPAPCGRRRSAAPSATAPKARKPRSSPCGVGRRRRGQGRTAGEHAAGGGGDAGCAETRGNPLRELQGPCTYAYPTVMPSSQTVTRLAAVPRVLAAGRRAKALIVAIVLLAGCGSEAKPPTKPPDPAKSQVALLKAPKRPGEILLSAGTSPPRRTARTPSTVATSCASSSSRPRTPTSTSPPRRPSWRRLDRRPRWKARAACTLFHAASRTGRRTLALHGRLFVDVSFGDFPYAMRFTPVK